MSQRAKLTKARIVLLGGPSVGKTAFAVRYMTRRFIGEYDANKEMIYSHKSLLDKDEVALDIVDTASGDDSALEQHIRTADGFIILYSVVQRESYHAVDTYMSRVHHVRHADNSRGFLPLVLVATKTDLEHVRKVTEDETVALGRRYCCPTYEVSVAENPDGVFLVIQDLLRQIKREFLRNLAGLEKRSSPLDNMKRVFKKKMTRSKSDTVC